MQKLLKAPEKLSIGEISRRLKENPEDPIILKEITDVIHTNRPQLTIVVQAFTEAIEWADSFNYQSSILVDAVQKLQSTTHFFNEISKSFKRILLNLSEVMIQLRNSMINFNKIPLLAGPAISGFLEAPNLMLKNFEVSTKSPFDDIDFPSIGYIEPRPNYTPLLLRIENQLERLADNPPIQRTTNSLDSSELLSLFPENNSKFKKLNKIMRLLTTKSPASLFQTVKCIYPTLTKDEFRNKPSYLDKLENKIRAMRRKLKPLGLSITIASGNCYLVSKK